MNRNPQSLLNTLVEEDSDGELIDRKPDSRSAEEYDHGKWIPFIHFTIIFSRCTRINIVLAQQAWHLPLLFPVSVDAAPAWIILHSR